VIGRRVVELAFGAHAQVVMGLVFVVITTIELVLWWKPTLQQIFIVSMEALYFASYAVMATGFAVLWLDKRTPGGDNG
jgi:hypothetical protein